MKLIALVGTIYKEFKIVDYKTEKHKGFLLVECPFCHNTKWIRKDHIDSGVKSCGCQREKTKFKQIDLTGKRIGKLVVICRLNEKKNGYAVWKCRCDCGNTIDVPANKLSCKSVISCGCAKTEYARTRGSQNLKNFVKNDCMDGTRLSLLSAKTPKNNTSGTKGVCFDKSRNKWTAQIEFQGQHYHLGRYANMTDAVAARKAAEEKLFKPIIDKNKYE